MQRSVTMSLPMRTATGGHVMKTILCLGLTDPPAGYKVVPALTVGMAEKGAAGLEVEAAVVRVWDFVRLSASLAVQQIE